jgi:hypothetical protein
MHGFGYYICTSISVRGGALGFLPLGLKFFFYIIKINIRFVRLKFWGGSGRGSITHCVPSRDDMNYVLWVSLRY